MASQLIVSAHREAYALWVEQVANAEALVLYAVGGDRSHFGFSFEWEGSFSLPHDTKCTPYRHYVSIGCTSAGVIYTTQS